jgi:hypothetical protein
MPESVCSERLKELQAEILTLEASREQYLMDREGAPEAPSQKLLELAATRLEEAVDHGEPQTVKSLLGALIDRVEGRAATRSAPSFAWTGCVLCPVSGGGRESNPPGIARLRLRRPVLNPQGGLSL